MGKRRLSREAKERRSKITGLFVLVIILAGASFYIFGISDKPAVETAVVKEDGNTSIELEEDILGEIEDSESGERKEMLSYIKPLYERNSDTVGYIKIGDTLIDYPVVYSGDNEYYMDRTFEKKESKEGAIFLDFRCDYQDFSKTRNMILYGHRMKDGSMFKELTNYLDKDFYEQHKTFRFDTLYEQHEWEVFAVFETDISFYYIDTDYPTDEKWMNFMQKCHELSKYKEDIKFYPTDTVLTLSTCAIKKNKRFVVMARLLR